MKKIKWLLLLPVLFSPMLLMMGCPKSPTAPNAALIENPWSGAITCCFSTGISVTGFYVQPYPGSSMSSAVIWLLVNSTGSYNYYLTVRDTAYNGSVIGTTSSGAVNLLNNSAYQPVTFAFGSDLGVTQGHTVTFVLNQTSGPGATSYCPQPSSSNNVNIILTNGTSPPLGNNQGIGVAVVVNS
jgi:hypothetical protein